MEIQELFIGARVMDGINPTEVTGLTCDGIVETTANENSNIEVIGPIPLTPEILEKNGFDKINQQDCVEPFYWQMKHYDEDGNLLFSITAFRNFSNGLKIYICNPSACETIHLTKQIKFVHELQIALKLCDIDKIIEL